MWVRNGAVPADLVRSRHYEGILGSLDRFRAVEPDRDSPWNDPWIRPGYFLPIHSGIQTGAEGFHYTITRGQEHHGDPAPEG